MAWLDRYETKSEPPQTYELGGGWGDHVGFFPEYEDGKREQRVTGHKMRRPKVGDFLRVPMQSGRVLTFKFIEVRLMRDPRDQFFGTVGQVAVSPAKPLDDDGRQ